MDVLMHRQAMILLSCLGVALVTPAPAAPVDFVRDVQPILSKNCYECHGPKAKGGVRLDLRDAATRGGVTGNTIVPGKAADSVIVHRLKRDGGEDRMPLRKPPLTDEQVATIAAWID